MTSQDVVTPEELIGDIPVLVVVVNNSADLARARDEGWYRIPLARAPRRIAADYLAFYQTGAFPEDERWMVRWLAPVRGYHVAARRELIPDEPAHPRAGDLYFQIRVGPLAALPRPIPSRRLRRITFIATTLGRLGAAIEINDLWIKSSAQERLWAALVQAGAEAERQYPLDAGAGLEDEGGGGFVADFALPGPAGGGAALIVTDEPAEDDELRETLPPDYLLAAHGWRTLYAGRAELEADPFEWARRLVALAKAVPG